MKAALIVNARAKKADLETLDKLRTALVGSGVEFLEFVENDKVTMSEFAQAAADDAFDIVIAAGGDGTISTVASKLVGTNSKLGIMPIGTYNNFAKDFGVPLDLKAAAEAIAAGNFREIDVGEVNGRFFVNNSGIGLYPHIVVRREWHENRGMPRPLASIFAVLKSFKSLPAFDVRLKVGGKELFRRTPLLFLGNGYYDYDGLDLGRREMPADGFLSLYLLRDTGRINLLKLSLAALSGRIRTDPRFEKHFVTEASIYFPKKLVYVAKDGEILKLESPLEYKIRPKALKIILPK